MQLLSYLGLAIVILIITYFFNITRIGWGMIMVI